MHFPHLYIPQGRHLEFEPIGILTGDGDQAFRATLGLIGFYHPHLLERVATRGRAVVTGYTTTAFKQLITGQLFSREGVFIAQQPLEGKRFLDFPMAGGRFFWIND